MANTGVTKMAALILITCLIHCAHSVPAQGLRERREADQTRQTQEAESGRARRNVELKMPWVMDSLTQKVQAERKNDILRNIIENENMFARVGRK